MNNLIYKQESYDIIGVCMEVHKELGKGFSKIVYGDALEIELKDARIVYQREVKFNITYRGGVSTVNYCTKLYFRH